QRTGYLVDGFCTHASIGLEEAQSSHHKPGAHLTLVFVAEVSVCNTASIIFLHDRPAPLLGKPGAVDPIEKEGKVHRLLIALYHRLFPILIVGRIVSPGFSYLEAP